jgi:hypothetical protein
MTLVRNPFDAGGYSLAEMTQAINILPNLYTRLGQIGLFRFEGVTQRSVIIEQYEGVLNLLPSVPLSGPSTVGTREGRSMRSFALPWIPHDDVILPGDIQGQPALGVFDGADPLVEVMNRKLQLMRRKHAQTREYMEMNALRGIVKDGAGTTLYNYFTEFGIAQISVDFLLGTAGTLGRDRVDLESLQRGNVARFGQSDNLDQLCAEPGVSRFGEIGRLRKSTALRLNDDGFAFADHRGGRSLQFVGRAHDRFARRIGVAVVEHQGQPGLGLIEGVGRHDRRKGTGRALVPDPCRQQAGEGVARLLRAGGRFDRGFRKALGEHGDLRGGEGFGFHGSVPSGVGDVGAKPKGGDRVDHGPAVTDRGAVSLCLGQGRELRARAGGGRPAAGGDKVRGVLEAEFFVVRQGLGGGFHGGLRCVAMAADSARSQKRATPKSLNR